jgi:hypothetical protein
MKCFRAFFVGCCFALFATPISAGAAKSLRLTPLVSTGDCGGAFYRGKVFDGPEVFHFSAENQTVAQVGLNGASVSVKRTSYSDKSGLRFTYAAGATKVSFSGVGQNLEEGTAYKGKLRVTTASGSTMASGSYYVGC